ncbi:Winged helix-turn-helix DNA-binding protein [compost metagenome]
MFIRNRPLDVPKKPPAKMVQTMDVTDMPLDPAKRWEWIKYQLRVSDCSCAELARQLGVTDRAIRAVKQHPYPRIERAIAQALDIAPVLLWPERWNADGTPCRQRPNRAESRSPMRPKDSGYVPVSHRKTGKEA